MRATGVLASLSSGPTGQTSSKALQLLIHAPVVVSSCGAIHTPALLLRSGITVGGNVGTNLRLHPATGVNGVFERTPEQAAAGRGAVDMHKVRCAVSGIEMRGCFDCAVNMLPVCRHCVLTRHVARYTSCKTQLQLPSATLHLECLPTTPARHAVPSSCSRPVSTARQEC